MVNTSDINNCKYVLELTSVSGCPIDDMDIRNICNVNVRQFHSFYR